MLISQRYLMEIVTGFITICFVSKYFIIFYHIYKKNNLFYFFSIEGANIFFGGAMHAYARVANFKKLK